MTYRPWIIWLQLKHQPSTIIARYSRQGDAEVSFNFLKRKLPDKHLVLAFEMPEAEAGLIHAKPQRLSTLKRRRHLAK